MRIALRRNRLHMLNNTQCKAISFYDLPFTFAVDPLRTMKVIAEQVLLSSIAFTSFMVGRPT